MVTIKDSEWVEEYPESELMPSLVLDLSAPDDVGPGSMRKSRQERISSSAFDTRRCFLPYGRAPEPLFCLLPNWDKYGVARSFEKG